ncbi:RloB family protein [Actinoallomurus sp. NPDC052274]|uniref:RloB family protein n=1 Tax=Actinoallomurus sp. NPDC052274 TaxID=3155420 RepID=UPI003433C6CF
MAERNPAVRVVIKTNPRSPSAVVKHAYKLKRQAPDDFDDVWCVFDVDEFQDIEDAVSLARRQGIGVAVSNPCFELWLLLHFDQHTAACPSYGSLLPLLRRHARDYDKAGLDFKE